MKKKQILFILILTFIAVIIGLSFVKIPLNIISNEIALKETQGNIELESFSKQYIKLLPSPSLILLDAKVRFPKYNKSISTNKIEINRNLFNSEKYEVSMDNTLFEKVIIQNLQLNILNKLGITSIKSNKFKFDDSSIEAEVVLEKNEIKSSNFSLKNFKVDKYKSLINDFLDFQFPMNTYVDVNGIYDNEKIIINSADIRTSEESIINFKGVIDLSDLFLSSLDISVKKLPTQILKNLIKLNFGQDGYSSYIPKGDLESAELKFEKNQIIIESLEIRLPKDNNFKLNGLIDLTNPLLSNFNVVIDKTDLKIIKNLLVSNFDLSKYYRYIPDAEIRDVNISYKNGLFNLKEINLITKSKNTFKVNSLGPIEDIENPDLELNIDIQNIEEFEKYLSQFDIKNQKDIFEYLDLKSALLKILIKDGVLEIINSDILTKNDEYISFLTEYFLSTNVFDELTIDIKGLSKNKSLNLISLFSKFDINNIADFIDFNKVNLKASITSKEKVILIKNLNLISDENRSNIEGIIFNDKFEGTLDLKKINLKKIDDYIFKTKRLNGYIDTFIEIDGPIGLDNITNTEGVFEGEIKVNISSDEIILISFVQSLASDIDDLEFFNYVSQKLINSFAGKLLTISGKFNSTNIGGYILEDIIFTAPDKNIIRSTAKINKNEMRIELIDIFNGENFIVSKKDDSYSFLRKNNEGIINDPVEDLIMKNINKLFENLLN